MLPSSNPLVLRYTEETGTVVAASYDPLIDTVYAEVDGHVFESLGLPAQEQHLERAKGLIEELLGALVGQYQYTEEQAQTLRQRAYSSIEQSMSRPA